MAAGERSDEGALRFLLLTSLLLATAAPAQSPSAEPITVSARPITSFQRAAIGEPVGDLLFKGGIELTSDHQDFGGISGLAFLDASAWSWSPTRAISSPAALPSPRTSCRD